MDFSTISTPSPYDIKPATKPPTTPAEWADWLGLRLDAQAREVVKWNAYYEGDHQTLFTQEKTRRVFGSMLDKFADNFCALIADSVAERMYVDGFRMGDDPGADKDAREIWQRNDMDAMSGIAHTESLVASRSVAFVWGNEDGEPTISIDDSAETILWYDPLVSRTVPQRMLKRWQDDWGTWHSLQQTPTQLIVMSSGGKRGRWDLDNAKIAPNPLGVVSAVELLNRPRLRRAAQSELARIAPLQDALNKVIRDALVASEFSAYPQRYLIGEEIRVDDKGQPTKPPFDLALDKLLQVENPDAKLGQFTATDLDNYGHLIDKLVQHMATLSRIPFHYFLLNGGQAPSGESIQSSEAGLISVVHNRQIHAGDAWERVMRLAFRVLNDPRADAIMAETIWRDAEMRTESQHIDALLKKKSLGVPMLQLWEEADYTPQQMARFPGLRAQLRASDPEIAEFDTPGGTEGIPLAMPAA